MKIAILGGGITGLTAGYYLAKQGHQVTIFEKENNFGGLASGFKKENWQWSLERTYHHIFSNDRDILEFSKEIGFNRFFFEKPITGSLYEKISNIKYQISNIQIKNQKFEIFPLDNPIDFFCFPYLNFFGKIRSGATLAFLKLSPFLPVFEKTTSIDFLKKTMGERSFESLFGELFRKKFGKYAGNILTSFFWARIKKRTKSLGYPIGGFQNFIDFIVRKLEKYQVRLIKNFQIEEIKRKNNQYQIIGKFLFKNKKEILKQVQDDIDFFNYDLVISTLPTPVLTQITQKIFPANFLQNLRKIKYLNALTLIIESKTPLLKDVYWLNVMAKNIPIMAIVEHTNFIDKKYYGGNHIIYLGWYLEKEDKLMQLTDDELLSFVKPYLKSINNMFYVSRSTFHVFRAPFAQPIFDKEFIKYKPNFITPVKNFYIANLDMTYPYDRGTNYAVKLGKDIAKLIIK
ncbi:MAG: NAD(P)/FAD-dependent oxidoreductase [Candidatus Microgenomates bacterium]